MCGGSPGLHSVHAGSLSVAEFMTWEGIEVMHIMPCCREGVVMVCTDAAARGIDIPHIAHVVQSSFAASAVDFLHRVSTIALYLPLCK